MAVRDHRQTEAGWNKKRADLESQIEGCLLKGVPSEINLSVPKHTATAPVLRRFAYNRSYQGREIPVVFRDSSRPTPFPVGCLNPVPSPTGARDVIKIGLSSFRHPDMEFLIDLYLMRNRELNAEPSMAAEEKLTFHRTVELLSDPALNGGVEIWAIHTGLEPMIMGFYRGVVKILQERERRGLPRTLVIKPLLYAPEGESQKHPGPDSSGSDPNSYIVAEPWW